MRKISAHYIYTNTGQPLKNGILIIDNKGVINEIIDTKGNLNEQEGLEFYSGIICPGFVNTHCHLELSYLRGKIPTGLRLPGFIRMVQSLRQEDCNIASIRAADEEMVRNGIVAVGDISNDNISFESKKKSSIRYHTFIEIFGGIKENQVNEIKARGINLYNELRNRFQLQGSITPHSPYSVSRNIFEFIQDSLTDRPSIISIHNQESADENLLFTNGKGDLACFLKLMGFESFDLKGKSSILAVFDYFIKAQNILLVHNIYTSEDDIKAISLKRNNIFWVFCPNSNLHIDGKLPDFNLFRKHHQVIAIGTDSLASNNKLSVLEEIKTISLYYPDIPLQEIIAWATINGAKALGMDQIFGKIQAGKAPGINLITGIDFHQMKLTGESEVEKLI